MAISKSCRFFLLAIVLATILSEGVEARRTILKGRKALTRTYYQDSAIPAWAVVLLVGIGEILVGAIVFFVMKKVVLDPPITGAYSPAATEA